MWIVEISSKIKAFFHGIVHSCCGKSLSRGFAKIVHFLLFSQMLSQRIYFLIFSPSTLTLQTQQIPGQSLLLFNIFLFYHNSYFIPFLYVQNHLLEQKKKVQQELLHLQRIEKVIETKLSLVTEGSEIHFTDGCSQPFLAEFPDGVYAGEVKRRLDELKNNGGSK